MSFTNSKIDKVYVVNLDKDKERLASFDRQMKKQNINYTRFPAVLGSKVNTSEYLTEFCNKHCTDGMKGCALSHHMIWQEAYEKKYNYILVFEDDALLNDNFDTKLKEVWSQIPDDFDIVYPGCRLRCDNSSVLANTVNKITNSDIEKIDENIHSFGGDLGTHCYIISRKCIEKIHNEIIATHVDMQLQIWINTMDLSAYFISPVIVTIDDEQFESNIAEQFPPLITSLFNKVYLSQSITLGWIINENGLKIFGFNVNMLVFLLFTLLCFVPIHLFKWFFGWLFIEFLVSQDGKNALKYLFFMIIPIVTRLRFAYETMPVKKIIKLL